MSEDIKQRILRMEKLPTIPALQPKIFEVIRKPTAKVQELVDVIKHDQVMASRIVAMANAPAYGNNGSIKDIEQAVFVLGFDSVKTIALGISLFVIFPMSKAVLRSLWTHSCTTAVLADMVYDKGGRKERGACFLAGLLHDIGRLVLMHLETETYFRKVLENKSVQYSNLAATEQGLFGCDHQQAGAWFLQSLSMPDDIVKVAALHHNPEEAVKAGDLSTAVCLAEALSSLCDRNSYGDGLWTAGHDVAAQRFGMAKADQTAFIDLFDMERKKLKDFFGDW